MYVIYYSRAGGGVLVSAHLELASIKTKTAASGNLWWSMKIEVIFHADLFHPSALHQHLD